MLDQRSTMVLVLQGEVVVQYVQIYRRLLNSTHLSHIITLPKGHDYSSSESNVVFRTNISFTFVNILDSFE